MASFVRAALLAALVALAACNRDQASEQAGGAAAPQLDAPAPAAEPSRIFTPANDAARTSTGEITVVMSLSLPDADDQNAAAQDTLTITGGNGLSLDGAVTSAVSPATQVQGQTLRALMSLAVEESQTLVYRVSRQARPSTGGLCGADEPNFIVVWEPSAPGEEVLKLMGVVGGAPGAAGARPCPMLEYRRN